MVDFLQDDVLPCVCSYDVRALNFFSSKTGVFPSYFRASSTATATETVMPTMGLLPVALFFLIELMACHFIDLSCKNGAF